MEMTSQVWKPRMQKGSASRRAQQSRELRFGSGSAGSSAQVSGSDGICRAGKSPRLPRLSSRTNRAPWVFSRHSSRRSKMAQADGSHAQGATQSGEASSSSPAPLVATEPLCWPCPLALTACSEPGGVLSLLGLCPPPGVGLQEGAGGGFARADRSSRQAKGSGPEARRVPGLTHPQPRVHHRHVGGDGATTGTPLAHPQLLSPCPPLGLPRTGRVTGGRVEQPRFSGTAPTKVRISACAPPGGKM